MATPVPKRANPPPPPPSSVVGGSVDLLTEILLRMPTKSVIRFQAVSKLWRSIISDAQFQSAHTLHHRNSPPVISGVYFRTEEYRGLSLTGSGGDNSLPSLNFLSPGFKIQQHCNGLLLCRKRRKLIVCNPTTKRFTQFSLPKDSKVSTLRASLAFDPSKSTAFQVFIPASYGFAAFSSETSSWTQIQVAGRSFEPSMLEEPVFCGGSIYWRDRSRSRLVRLDTASHRVSQTPSLRVWLRVHYIGERRGELVLLVSSVIGDYELVMPELDGDWQNNWFVKSHINVKPVGSLGRGGRIVVMSVSSDESGEDLKVVVAFENRVYCYSWKMNTIDVILELPEEARPRNSNSLSYKNVYGFAESLATV